MTDTLQSSTATHTTPVATSPFPTLHPEAVRARLLARDEMLFADLREEDPYAKGHPLWAANFPFGRLELDVLRRVPRRDVLIVLYGEDDYRDLAPLAAAKLRTWGYTNVHLLEGGLQAWERQGYQMFIDVNVPSKAFGEWVESLRHTPLLPAEDVHRLIDSDKPPVILDVRRYDEYHTMSIPTGISVPGAELVLRVRELAPDPETTVVVNCAGRTRSIIGTQSLINAGIPNPVVGLRNGTIGWLLAGLKLDNGATRRFPEARPDARRKAQADARRVAERAGVRRVSLDEAASLAAPGGASTRTVYRVDVRTAEEYRDGHLPGFINVPGGQLVQETDHTAAVRGALIFLADDDGVRADMSASWLAQMGWEVYVIDPLDPAQRTETGDGASETIPPSDVKLISPQALSDLLARNDGGTMVLDVTTSANYVKGHIPGAWFVLRAQLDGALRTLAQRGAEPERFVVTCGTSALARHAAPDVQAISGKEVFVLEGGNQAWREANFPVETGEAYLVSARTDRYRRPYEGTEAPRAAMEAYLEWEYGLVAQLEQDATHFFTVI
ncbi:sulfurtransferase [Robbsia andropogonis]|uniref:Sulfurtransferase n=1 Tax=Robbsia andropogonis TaxID=28092 RepID=A0A0F5K2V3_9BURK|nr:rhodanese-related sulfurtransferase [Robbsia andropogonis]KKB64260.1 sulfurtransferase [Robbsia andropogonis]